MNTLRLYQNEGLNLYRHPFPLYYKIAVTLFPNNVTLSIHQRPALTYPNFLKNINFRPDNHNKPMFNIIKAKLDFAVQSQ
jgi:hypothetical protein